MFLVRELADGRAGTNELPSRAVGLALARGDI